MMIVAWFEAFFALPHRCTAEQVDFLLVFDAIYLAMLVLFNYVCN